jgi:hypothetical protein
MLLLWGVHRFNYYWVDRARPRQRDDAMRYQYLTFRWPKDTLAATLIYSRQTTNLGPVSVTGVVTEESLKLAGVLERVRQLGGYEYCGAVGDNFILRRVVPGPPDLAETEGMDLTVLPSPPDRELPAEQ